MPTPQGFRLLNIGKKANPEFLRQVVAAVEVSNDIPDVELHAAHYVSGYPRNDWSKQPDGKSYRDAIG